MNSDSILILLFGYKLDWTLFYSLIVVYFELFVPRKILLQCTIFAVIYIEILDPFIHEGLSKSSWSDKDIFI